MAARTSVVWRFLREKLAGRMNPTIRCVEPAACNLTQGEYRYDFGDTAGMTPLMKMHTLGHGFILNPSMLVVCVIAGAAGISCL